MQEFWAMGSQAESTVSLPIPKGNTKPDFCSGESNHQALWSNPVTPSRERPSNGPITPPETTGKRKRSHSDGEKSGGQSPSTSGYKRLKGLGGSCGTEGTYQREDNWPTEG